MLELDGDGRIKLEPTFTYPGTAPIAVTRAQARQTVERFKANGRSNHSGSGSTLWVVLQFCADTRTPFTLSAFPGEGYEVEIKDSP